MLAPGTEPKEGFVLEASCRSVFDIFHGTIDNDVVDQWLRQFEHLGNHREVGAHLLQLLDVLPTTELGDCICEGAEFWIPI